MPLAKIKKSDLYYTDYSDTAVKGDDPKKTLEDADRFSRHESYEVIYMINAISWKNDNSSLASLLIVEWMIHEKLPSNIQGWKAVKAWIQNNFSELKGSYPR